MGEENARFYSGDAPTYDESRWSSRGGSATKQLQEELFREMTRGWGDELTLEVGPGTGRFSSVLAESQSALILTDVAAGMLPLAVDAVGTRGGRVSAVRGSVLDLPFVAGSFAHVVCLNVLNHVDDLDGALVSLGRVLRPGGELLFNYANLRGIYWPAAVMINRRGKAIGQDVPSRWVSPADVQRAMSAAGLAPLGERGHIHAPRSLDRLLGERVLRFANRSVERGLSGRGSFVFVRARFDP